MRKILQLLFARPGDVGFMLGLALVTVGASIERASLGWIVPGAVLCAVTILPYIRGK